MKRIKLSSPTIQICFVCIKIIDLSNNKKFVCIGHRKDGTRLYRHSDCHTGSNKWLQSSIAKKSQFYNCFNQKEN